MPRAERAGKAYGTMCDTAAEGRKVTKSTSHIHRAAHAFHVDSHRVPQEIETRIDTVRPAWFVYTFSKLPINLNDLPCGRVIAKTERKTKKKTHSLSPYSVEQSNLVGAIPPLPRRMEDKEIFTD